MLLGWPSFFTHVTSHRQDSNLIILHINSRTKSELFNLLSFFLMLILQPQILRIYIANFCPYNYIYSTNSYHFYERNYQFEKQMTQVLLKLPQVAGADRTACTESPLANYLINLIRCD